jgi:hypothetical protein
VNPPVKRIIRVCAAAYGTTPEELSSDSLEHRATFARHMAMYLARKLTRFSLTQIGEKVAGRDHTVVLYAHRKVTQAIAEQPHVARAVEAIEGALATRAPVIQVFYPPPSKCRRRLSVQWWTDEEVAFLRESWGRKPTMEIAARLKRTKDGVENKAWKLGLSRKYRREQVMAAIDLVRTHRSLLADLASEASR